MATDDEYRLDVPESIRIMVEGELARKNHSQQSNNVTICVVPESLRNLNPYAYTPRIASIGPIHRKDPRLTAMEEHKLTYTYRLFCRIMESTKDPNQTARTCVQAVLGVLPRARACYAPSFTSYTDIQLAEMMVIDGCFILELLYRFQYGIGEGDPIFDNILVLHDVKYDLLLLENQIPFFILEILFSITVKRIMKSTSLINLIFYFIKDMNILNSSELFTNDEKSEHCHILGLLQSCYRPEATMPSEIPTISYSATEIAGSGFRFKPHTDAKFQLAVIFKQTSLIPWLGNFFVRETSFRIPPLRIKDSTSTILRNLIAYEQCYPLSRHYVTSFAFLMDRLIDTKEDVSLLVRSKVLRHNLGASQDVTNLFNDICNGVVLRDFYYYDEWKQVHDYCNRFWPSKLIALRRLYRSTTWKTLDSYCCCYPLHLSINPDYLYRWICLMFDFLFYGFHLFLVFCSVLIV